MASHFQMEAISDTMSMRPGRHMEEKDKPEHTAHEESITKTLLHEPTNKTTKNQKGTTYRVRTTIQRTYMYPTNPICDLEPTNENLSGSLLSILHMFFVDVLAARLICICARTEPTAARHK